MAHVKVAKLSCLQYALGLGGLKKAKKSKSPIKIKLNKFNNKNVVVIEFFK